jgi:PEP-CTERM motif
MKRFCQAAAILSISLVLPALLINADPIDPVFSMEDPGEGTPITSTSFIFNANELGGGISPFMNESGVAWSRVDFTVQLALNSIISCGPSPFFTFCQISVQDLGNNQGQWKLSLIGPINGGVLNGQFFQINLNDFIEDGIQNPDPNGSGGWGSEARFGGVANSTPEPATLGLLACGIAAVALARMRKNQRS